MHTKSSFKYNVTKGLQAKFVVLNEFKPHWEAAMAEMATDPASYKLQIELLSNYINDLCFESGDESGDFGYYVRRASLFGIYNTSMAVFIQDDSEDIEVTRRFIEISVASYLQ